MLAVETPVGGNETSVTRLPAGQGRRFRRELLARSVMVTAFAMVLLIAAMYGGYGTVSGIELGSPLLIFGVAGAMAQGTLAAAMLHSRAAISGDTYRTAAVHRARTVLLVVLLLVAAAAIVAVAAVAMTVDRTVAGAATLGLAGVAGITLDGLRPLYRLASHAGPDLTDRQRPDPPSTA